MRQAGEMASESDARLLVDYLLTLGIEARADRAGDAWIIWIYDENQLGRSKDELATFRENPRDDRYAAAPAAASTTRRHAAQAQRKIRKNIIEVRQQWEAPQLRGQPVTWSLIVLAVVVAIATRLGNENGPAMSALMIKPFVVEDGEIYSRTGGLTEVYRGQVWRLFTPALLHFGVLHLVMNLYWMHFLGGMIERRGGSWFLATLVLVTGVVSNLAQYYAVGPFFGGLSGVIAGLFAYAVVRFYRHRDMAYFIHPTTVFLILATMLIATTGRLGAIANWAHGAGLLVGVVWGYLPDRRHR